jgi:predicted permease
MLDFLRQDVRYAIRGLFKSPGFSVTVILLLALGIGSNTAIFSIINALVLKQLPVKNAQELVLFGHGRWMGVNTGITGLSNDLFSEAQWVELKSDRTLFQDATGIFSIYFSFQSFVGGSSSTEPVKARLVTGNYFSLLGVQAAAGRLFTEAVDSPQNAHPEIVLSYGFAKRRFSTVGNAIGQKMRIGNALFTVTGVSESQFFGTVVGESPDAWIPMSMLSSVPPFFDLHGDKMAQAMYVVARMQPGVSLQRASAAVTVHLQSLLRAWNGAGTLAEDLQLIPRTHVELTPLVSGLAAHAGRDMDLRDAFARPLEIMMLVVGLVLLIACANIGNLMLTRAIVRMKEIGLRFAVGGSRWRILRQLLTEGFILALFGVIVSIFFALLGRRALVALVSSGPNPVRLDGGLDLKVLGFALLMGLVSTVLFGIAPAISASLVKPLAAMKQGGGGSVGFRWPAAGRVLMVSQIALSVTLLVAAALLLQSFRHLANVDTGFDRKTLVVSIDPAAAGYKRNANIATLYRRLEDRVGELPGVRHAALSTYAVNEGERSLGLGIETHPEVLKSGNTTRLFVTGNGYLDATGIPLRSGRFYDSRDTSTTQKVGVMNQQAAKAIFGTESPIGKRFSIGAPTNGFDIEIIGVVGSARYAGVQEDAPWAIYVPYTQRSEYARKLLVRAEGPTGPITTAIRKAIGEVDPNIPIQETTTMDDMVVRTFKTQQMLSRLSSFFGTLALLIVAVGLYGRVSYTVACRTAEIGVRMALGAQRHQVLLLVIRETMLLVAAGTLIGVPIAFASSRLIANMLFGVKATDAITFLSILLLLAATGAIAGLVPARRASKIDPLVALRYE